MNEINMSDTTATIDLEAALGIESFSPEVRAEISARARRSIFKSIFVQLLEQLNEKEQAELITMLEDEQVEDGAAFAYMRERVENFDVIVKKEIDAFKKEGLELLSAMS